MDPKRNIPDRETRLERRAQLRGALGIPFGPLSSSDHEKLLELQNIGAFNDAVVMENMGDDFEPIGVTPFIDRDRKKAYIQARTVPPHNWWGGVSRVETI